MGDDRTKMLYQAWQQASEKFDYFVVGAAGALVAYLGQHVPPTRLALNAGTLELAALALLLGAVVAGLKRIETSVTLLRMNSQLLHTQDGAAAMAEASRMPMAIEGGTGTVLTGGQWARRAHLYRESTAEGEAQYAKTTAMAHRYYRWRNRLLLTGFVILIAARVLPAYLGATP